MKAIVLSKLLYSGKDTDRVALDFRDRKGGKYRGAFLLGENDDLASKHELAHGVKRKRSD